MKNQKIVIRLVLIGAFWFTALFQMLTDYVFADDNKIVTAFASTNVKLAQSKLEITAEWNNNYFINKREDYILKNLASVLGFEGEYKVEKKEKRNQTIHYIKIEQDNLEAIIEVNCISNQVYGYMELIISDRLYDILAYKTKGENAYRNLGAKNCQSILKFYGEYPGQLSIEKQQQEMRHMFHNLNAKVVTEVEEDGIYTVYGYTKMMKSYMKVFRHRINLNLAFSYNEDKNITNLYLATPIISDDY